MHLRPAHKEAKYSQPKIVMRGSRAWVETDAIRLRCKSKHEANFYIRNWYGKEGDLDNKQVLPGKRAKVSAG